MGWLFSAPAFIGLMIFVAIPIVLTAWVSLRDWSGLVSPFETEYIGFENYRELLLVDGVRRTDFALSIRNNFYYVLFVVPMQTILAFVLAVILNNKFLKGKGFFRTAYYFPSITSSIAVTLIFRTLDAFRVFDAVYVLTEGGPANTTETLSIYAYKMLMRAGDFGYGSTLAVVTFICVMLISVVYLKVLGKEAGAR